MEVQNAYEAGAQIESMHGLALDADQELLGRLFSRYIKQLYRTAFRVLGSREDAEDAVQDGLLAATRNLKSFEGRSQFSTWLTRIVVNAALMRRRKISGHATASIDQKGPDEWVLPLAARIADPRPNPEQVYAQEERLEILKATLESLPARYRSALWLLHIEGMTIQEAATVLCVSEGTLKSRLHRARLKVARHIHGMPRARARALNKAGSERLETRNKTCCKEETA